MDERRNRLNLANQHLEIAKEKLDVANLLYKNNKLSDAVSRAYYSAFHAMKAVLILIDADARTHKGVMFNFYSNLVKEGFFPKSKMNKIQRIHDLRMNSDYGIIPLDLSPEECLEALNSSKELIDFAKSRIRAFEEQMQ